MKKGFIIFFHGAEGTSPVVRLLNNFNDVNIVHQTEGKGWEPFDEHNAGDLSLANLTQCFRLLFNKNGVDFDQLNQVYSKTAVRPLEKWEDRDLIGFKMRFYNSYYLTRKNPVNKIPFVNQYLKYNHKQKLKSLLKELDITVFISARQNVFRRALSKYHGEKSGRDKKHFQFKVAKGEINPDDINKIQINPTLFSSYIQHCKQDIESKRKLFDELQNEGIKVFPLLYEDFVESPQLFFKQFFSNLQHLVSDNEIQKTLETGTNFKKVHADDISKYVINHEEINERFSHEFVKW